LLRSAVQLVCAWLLIETCDASYWASREFEV
jgi:hypothetical protein